LSSDALARLASLDARARDAVLASFSAVEMADVPVEPSRFEGLRDPGLRTHVAGLLTACGRSLIAVNDGWLSAYDDRVADALTDEGTGILGEKDRAVLALVLLYTVAIPRARGRITGTDWTQAEPTTVEQLQKHRFLTRRDIQMSLRTLRSMGVLRPGLRGALAPGPQFLRLTEARSRRIWDELVVVAQPESTLAQVIRRRHKHEEELAP
jgi:hypothetical protein